MKIIGEGTAQFRGQHTCRVQFQVRDSETGEVKRVSSGSMRVSSQSKKEKERCKREFRAQLEGSWNADEEQKRVDELEMAYGLDPAYRDTTFGAVANEWWEKTRVGNPGLAASTIEKDRRRLDVINSHLGDLKIRSMDDAVIEDFQNALRVEHGLSGTTAHDIRVTLNAILKYAVRRKALNSNPCMLVDAPRRDTKEKEPMSHADVGRMVALLNASNPRPSLVGFRLALLAGLRRGEICAVTWKDFDEEAGTLCVRRSLDARTLKFKEPKTAAGIRTLPLDPQTVDYLVRFRERQKPVYDKLGKSMRDACIVSKPQCDYMHPENLNRSLKRFCRAYSFDEITPHILRHTFCTELFRSGETNIKRVQYLMGHADGRTTFGIYLHYRKEEDVAAAAESVRNMVASLPTEGTITPSAGPRGRWGVSAETESSDEAESKRRTA